MVLAVLQRRAQVKVGACDVYASTVGGVRLTEPATDLAVALAVAGVGEERRRSPPGWSRSARSAWPARSGGSPAPPAGSPRPPGSVSPMPWCRPTRAGCLAGIVAIEVRDLAHALRVAFPGAEVIPFASRRH